MGAAWTAECGDTTFQLIHPSQKKLERDGERKILPVLGEDRVRIATGSVEDEGCVREGGVRGIGGGDELIKNHSVLTKINISMSLILLGCTSAQVFKIDYLLSSWSRHELCWK